MIRLLKLLSFNDVKYDSVKQKLLNNIKSAIGFDGSHTIYAIVLAILSAPSTSKEARQKICELLGIQQNSFAQFKEPISEWLKNGKDYGGLKV